MKNIQWRYSIGASLMLLHSPLGWAQSTPTVTLTTSCTAPCNAPGAITLTATGTVSSGRTISKIEFYEGSTRLATDTSSPYSAALTAVAGGSHTYTAKIYDSAATPLTATSSPKVVTVNQAPTITLAAACTAPCTGPASVALTATPADADGSITKVQFYRGATLISTKTAAPWTFSDTSLAAGSYSYTAKATDNASTPLVTTSSAQAITVNAPSTAPTVALTATCTAPCVGPASVSLTATGTVGSGKTIKRIEFYDGATLLSSDTTSPYAFTASSVASGTHSYTAKIFDSATTPLTATSSPVAITVNAAPAISITATCAASPCSVPATVNLVATPSDADGTISKVEFYRGSTLVGTSTAAPWSLSDTVSGAGTYSYTGKAFDSATPAGTTTSSAKSVTVTAATTTTYNLTPDGADVAVSLPGTLTPLLKFTAQAGDYLSLRVWSTTGAYVQGSFVMPANSAAFSSTAPSASTTLLYGPANSMSDGYVDLLVRTAGEYSIRLSGYGSSAQSLKFALLRAAAPVTTLLDGTSQAASNTRVGQPIHFQVTSATGIPHIACALSDAPGWRDVNGNPVEANPAYLATVKVLTPSQRVLSAFDGGDCMAAGPSYLTSSEVGTYTFVVTPNGQYSGGRTLALFAPAPAATLMVDALPISWTGNRQIMDGARFQVPVVAGQSYAIVIGKSSETEQYRNFSLQIEGADPATYYPFIENGTAVSPAAAWRSFVASTTGVIGFSILGADTTIPVAVSVAKNFAPSATFLDPSANKLYLEIPYFNGVASSGNGNIPVKSAAVWAYRTGWSSTGVEPIAGSLNTINAQPYGFSWPASPRDTVYGSPTARTLLASVTFANNVSVRAAELPLTYQTRTGLLTNPVGLFNGKSTDDDQISFSGIAMTDNANVGVLINDIPVPTVGGSLFAPHNQRGGQFAINNLPISVGTNNIAVAVHQLAGTQTYNYAVTRVAAGAKNFSVHVLPDGGDAPLTPTVTVKNLTNAPWQRVSIQFGTNAPVDVTSIVGDTVRYVITLNSVSAESKGGVIPVHVAVFGANEARLLQTTRFVSLRGESESVNAAFGAYTHMRTRAAAGDAPGALQAFNDLALIKFKPMFDALGPSITALANLDDGLYTWSISQEMMQVIARRGTKAFPLQFTRSKLDGLWRISDM